MKAAKNIAKKPWWMSQATFDAERKAAALDALDAAEAFLHPKPQKLPPPVVRNEPLTFYPPTMTRAEAEANIEQRKIAAENEKKRQEYLAAEKKRDDERAKAEGRMTSAEREAAEKLERSTPWSKKLLPDNGTWETNGGRVVWIVRDKNSNEVPIYFSGQPAQLHKDEYGRYVDYDGYEVRLKEGK